MAFKYALRKEIALVSELTELQELSYNLYLDARGLQ